MLRLVAGWTRLSLRALGATRQTIDLGDGVELVVNRIGPADGEPWVLLHGLGSTALSWAPVLRHLRRDALLLAPELSALGGSRVPGGNLTIARATALLPRLLEQLVGDRPVTLAGTSLGGWIAIRTTLSSPHQVDRLVLLCAGGYLDQDWEAVERVMRVRSRADIPRLQAALFADPPWWTRLATGGFHAIYTSHPVQTILEQTTEADGFGDDELATISAPTAVIWGEHDGIFDVEVGRRIAAALPRSQLHVIPETAHLAHWEAPRAFLAALDSFRAAYPPTPLSPTAANNEVVTEP